MKIFIAGATGVLGRRVIKQLLAKGYEVAKALQIPAAKRDLFLDHDDEPDAIRARFREAMHIAQQEGRFIAICHFRPNTAQVLTEMLPELEVRDIQLVHASELVQ